MFIDTMVSDEQHKRRLRKSGPPHVAGEKARAVSMPPTLTNNSTQPSIYSQPSRFSISGSPPIIDFTEWAENFRGQRFGISIPNDFPPETSRTGLYSVLPHSTKGSLHGWRIDNTVLLNALRPLVDSQGKVLEDILRIDAVETLHRQDQDCLVKLFQMESAKGGNLAPCIDGVIGKPLSDVFLHASLSLSIAGTQHFVPTLVVKCVEELYRTGLYQPQLFRRTPNFGRVEELVEIYDHRELPGAIRIARQRPNHTPQFTPLPHGAFGSQTSLHMETTENICALLRTFLQYLPEPILSPCLFEAIWNFCGVRQEAFQSSFRRPSPQGTVNVDHLGSSISSEELVRIYIAQIMIHLLPTPNFSLLVYVLAFFSQVVMVHEENGLAIDDVASMFGTIVFGGAAERIVFWTDSKPRPRGDIMMRWFLRRWRQIYHGLFPYDDEGRQSNSGLSSLSPATEKVDTSNNAKDRRMSGYFGLQDPPSVSAHDLLTPVREETEEVGSPRVSDSANGTASPVLPLDPTGKPVTHTEGIRPTHPQTSESFELTSNYLEELWPHLTSELRIKLNERMLDVMLEPLLSPNISKNLIRRRSNTVPTRLKPVGTLKPPTQDERALERQLAHAKQRILELESRIRDNKRLLQDTMVENRRVKDDNTVLEDRVRGLEIKLELRNAKYKASTERASDGMKEAVEEIMRERDEAREIVSEIQRISGLVNGGRAVAGDITSRN